MAVDPGLLELFTDVVTIQSSSGAHDLYGRETAGASRTAPAFIEREPRLVQSREGREVISNATIYVDDVAIAPTDRIFYEDGTEANIVLVSVPRDENGPAHSEVSVT